MLNRPHSKDFLSTLSLRRATFLSNLSMETFRFFYPRSPCGERHRFGRPIDVQFVFSIHALLAESDIKFVNLRVLDGSFSIHALLAESDVVDTVEFAGSMLFLSTLSLRRATPPQKDFSCLPIFSIHALLAESDRESDTEERSQDFSIHALLAESDPILSIIYLTLMTFLSTLSLRRATVVKLQ